MNTCGTCKYKTDDPENNVRFYPDTLYRNEMGGWVHRETNEPVALDSEGNPLPIKTFFLCGRIKQKDYLGDDEAMVAKALVVDGSGYYAALCVEDDFGCNQWEAK